jgi:4'-phosphopantetheinyl transferase EntD
VREALAAIVPAGVVAVERDAPPDEPPALYPCEEALVADAVEGRRREFAEARACAREALRRLGAEAGAIPADSSGAPCWPAGVVGSITHKGSYRAAAVASDEQFAGLGIDAELDAGLPPGVLETIASAREIEEVERLLASRPGVAWDRLLFSAKEAVVKAAYPVRLGAAGVRGTPVRLDGDSHDFDVAIATHSGPLTGSWTVSGGMLLTVASVTRA